MVRSRLRRFEEKKEMRLIAFSVIGILSIFIFGVRILIAFSLFVDRLRGTPVQTQQQQTVVIFPPQLDALPEATNSSTIVVSGKTKDATKVIIYVNDSQAKKAGVETDGTFRFPNIPLTEGTNTVSAKALDKDDNTSDLSQVLTIVVKKGNPKLDITSPNDNETISGEKQEVKVSGTTDDPENTVKVNGRLVVLSQSGTFNYTLPLSEGEQTITIIALDAAGNQTKVERKVTYKK